MTRPPDAPGWWPLLRAEAQPLLQRPLVWLTVALLLGIIWADGFRPPPLPVTLTCGAAVLLTACALGRAPRVASRLLLLCVFLLGGALHAGRVTPRAEVRALPTQLKLPELEARVCSVERRASWGQSVVLDLEPFVRGEPARTVDDKGGFGLGLSIVASLTEKAGGKFELLDRAPNGLIARVALPAAFS